jgi:hypothetical protein
MSGYCNCACRDCFEIAISGDDDAPDSVRTKIGGLS